MLKLRTVKIAYWVFCASKHNRKFQILTFGEILTIRFSNLNRIRIRILFGFGKSCEYEYEYIRFWKIIRIRIRILFGLKISAEYEYEYHYSVSTIRILFEYRIIRSPLLHTRPCTERWWAETLVCPRSNKQQLLPPFIATPSKLYIRIKAVQKPGRGRQGEARKELGGSPSPWSVCSNQ